MKKIFAISLIAMTAVTAANAEIASKAYVDQERDVAKTYAKDYTDTKIGAIEGADVAAAIAAAVQSGTNNAVTHDGAVGNATTPVYVTAAGVATAGTALGTMAYEAAGDYTKTGLDTTYAKQSDFTTLQSAVNNETTGLAATKAIADANKSAIENSTTGLAATKAIADAALPSTTAASTYQTLANISTNMTTDTGSDTKYPSVKAVETAIGTVNSAASGLDTRLTTAEGKITAIEGSDYATSGITSAKVSDYDAAVSAVNNATSGLAATNTLAVAALPKTEAASTYQTLANLATSTSWDTDKSSDTKYASAKAVDAAITAAGYDDTALAGRVTTAEGKITTAEGDIDALEALVGNTAVATQISTATSDMETQTHAAATYQTLDNLATSTSWDTDKSSDTKYASAKAVDAAITAAGYDDTALAGRVTAIEGSAAYTSGIDSTKVAQIATNASDIAAINNATTGILATAEAYTDTQLADYTPTTDLKALAFKDTVGTDQIDANAVTLAKLSATLPSGCTATGAECVLKSSNGALAWEVIQRATGE